jgi:hypothetical protein
VATVSIVVRTALLQGDFSEGKLGNYRRK